MKYTEWYGKGRSQEWRTPPALFEKLHNRYHFNLDGAADKKNALLPEYSSAEKPISWVGRRVFCNPPWSDIPPFIEYASQAELAVLLVPARPNSKWFHRALKLGAQAKFFVGRPKFLNDKKPNAGSSPVDCLLLVWDDELW